MLETVIIDDEPLARKGLKEYIADVDFLHLAGEFDNPLAAMNLLGSARIDLIFLDIQMPKLTGIEFLKILPSPPMVIFTTAYPQYAVEGFEWNAIDYLVKPFSFDRFLKAAMKAQANAAGTKPPAQENKDDDYFFIKADNRLVRIKLDDLLYAEALQNYVALHTREKKFITYLTFKAVEDHLPADRFIRIHKSFIVSVARIDSIEANEVRIGQTTIPISRAAKDEFMEKILQNKYLRR